MDLTPHPPQWIRFGPKRTNHSNLYSDSPIIGSFPIKGFLSSSSSNSTITDPSTVVTSSATTTTNRDKRKFVQITDSTDDSSDYLIEDEPSRLLSSTLNESIINHLADCNLNNQQPFAYNTTPRKKQKITSNHYYQFTSPIQEVHDILYDNKIKLKSSAKISQQKIWSTPIKNHFLFEEKNTKRTTILLKEILKCHVIMDIIFRNLSDNDIYRFGKVNELTKFSVRNNLKARQRYLKAKHLISINKENYKITPPNSPNSSSDGDSKSPSSPDNTPKKKNGNFADYVKAKKFLKPHQRLEKCPQCEKPCIVDNQIAQCINSKCRYIFCLNCLSFSKNGPENFLDECNNSKLLLNRKLNDISNLNSTNNNTSSYDSFSFLSSSASASSSTMMITSYDSGFQSDNDSSFKVRKNLSNLFSNNNNNNNGSNIGGNVGSNANVNINRIDNNRGNERKILKINNQNPFNDSNLKKSKHLKELIRKQQRNSDIIVPVVALKTNSDGFNSISGGGGNNGLLIDSPPPSPPKIQNYSIGSKQSKRNVKRATR